MIIKEAAHAAEFKRVNFHEFLVNINMRLLEYTSQCN